MLIIFDAVRKLLFISEESQILTVWGHRGLPAGPRVTLPEKCRRYAYAEKGASDVEHEGILCVLGEGGKSRLVVCQVDLYCWHGWRAAHFDAH